jgi:chromosome segregation ATPase
LQEELKQRFIATKVANEEESERHTLEHQELKKLQALKRKLLQEKQIAEKDCELISNELQQHVHDRRELEQLARKLTEQLEQVQLEKQALTCEYTANKEAIDGYNHELRDLKEELNNMKNVIAHTFEEELRTPSHVGGVLLNQSKMSKKF